MKRGWRPNLKFVALAAVGALVLATVVGTGGQTREDLRFDELTALVSAGDIDEITLNDETNHARGTLRDGTEFESRFPGESARELAERINEVRPATKVEIKKETEALWVTFLLQIVPLVLLAGLFYFMIQSARGGGRAATFGRARAKLGTGDIKVTFADVAGADEAIEELEEIKEFLKKPQRFYAMGARIPKGVLLYGPPGTGKTLLARAVAGEANVPFYSISGSDFVEMFVGVGASRVRDLFERAKKTAPAIIFIDEIDAVGRHRGAGVGGGHDEREQTLNQMLVEMDGFGGTSGVIVIAATNRPDILDPALLRPGRFDRRIMVDRPDLAGRRSIVEVHAKGKPLAAAIDAEVIARRTPGFTGADLANVLNEAALLAARRDKSAIEQAEIDDAVDRVIAGPERKNRLIVEREKRIIAYHEAGHAIVGHVLPNTDPIHRVSVVGRGRALGWTLSLPTEDRHLRTRSELRDEIAMLLGGRAAEELIFGDPTTGSANDIERASQLARAMVTEYGMSDAVGPLLVGRKDGEVFLGKEGAVEGPHSDRLAELIDTEVRRFVEEAHMEAREILSLHRPVLDRLAEALFAQETLDEAALAAILGPLDRWEGRPAASLTPPMPGSRSASPSWGMRPSLDPVTSTDHAD